MSRGLDLEIEGPVCAAWRRNMERVRAIARQWWSFAGGAIHPAGEQSGLPASGQGLFFGGGVDSLFALHQERKKLSHLIYVEGYDVPLADGVRLEKVSQANRRLARECGLRLITVRTNLRRHPDFKILSWSNSFGGALAGVGHLLRQHCGTFLICGDGHLQEIDPRVLGTHPALVPEWASGSVRFILHGDGVSRHAKAGVIGRWPIARETLRVCWEFRNENLNCGVCEKCLRTRLELLAGGITDPLPVFPDAPIIANLDRIQRLSPNLFLYYQEMFDDLKDPAMRQAIQELGNGPGAARGIRSSAQTSPRLGTAETLFGGIRMKGLAGNLQANGHYVCKRSHLPASHRKQLLSLRGFSLPGILCPAVQNGNKAQTHYVFPASNSSAFSIQVNLRGAEENCRPDFEAARNQQSVDPDDFPYGLSESEWWNYCVAPHSYLLLEAGQCQVGLNFFNRFLHLDLNRRSAELVDPGVGNEMLSTTNWFNQNTGELWFASWPVEDTVQRMLHPQKKVRVKIWRLSVRDRRLHRVWQGDFADSLHQLSLSPDHRFLILTELGLRLEGSLPAGPPAPAVSAGKRARRPGIIPSEILVLDLKTGTPWRLPMLTASHVEFDPEAPGLCYLSGHNLGLIGDKVGIFGPGVIRKFALKKSGLELLGQFSAPGFHRVSTHIVFRHRGKVLIGVSGYPHTVFLIDAATMKLYRTLEMDAGGNVDTSHAPISVSRTATASARPMTARPLSSRAPVSSASRGLTKGGFVSKNQLTATGPIHVLPDTSARSTSTSRPGRSVIRVNVMIVRGRNGSVLNWRAAVCGGASRSASERREIWDVSSESFACAPARLVPWTQPRSIAKPRVQSFIARARRHGMLCA